MKKWSVFVLSIVHFTVWGSLPAAGQEAGSFGLTIGYPTAIGVQWHVTDGVGLRLNVSGSTQSGESVLGDNVSTSDTSDGTVGGSLLWYVSKAGDLRTYVSPGVSFTRSQTTSLSQDGRETVNKNSIYGLRGSFGVHYSLGERFAVFGEAGLLYQRREGSTLVSLGSNSSTTSNTLAPTAGVGLAYYF